MILDTHWESTFEHIITSAERREGKFTSHELPRGMRQIPYDMPGDPELALALREAGGGPRRHVGPRVRRPVPADLLRHDQHLDAPGKGRALGRASSINQCGQTEDFLLLGELLGEAVAATDRRVVVLASGGMTHRFFPFRELRKHESSKAPENILHLESYEADQRVIRMLQEGDHMGVIDWMPEYKKAAPEGHFGHYLIMAGAIGGARCQAPGELFSEYEASVGTGQVHVWFERPADGWTGQG